MFSAFHTRCTMRLHKCTIAVLGKNLIEMSNKTVTSEERKVALCSFPTKSGYRWNQTGTQSSLLALFQLFEFPLLFTFTQLVEGETP